MAIGNVKGKIVKDKIIEVQYIMPTVPREYNYDNTQHITHSSFACCRVGRATLARRLPIRFISVNRFIALLFPWAKKKANKRKRDKEGHVRTCCAHIPLLSKFNVLFDADSHLCIVANSILGLTESFIRSPTSP